MARGRWLTLCLTLLVITCGQAATARRPSHAKPSRNEVRTPWGFSCIELRRARSKGGGLGTFLARQAGVELSAPEGPPIYISEIYPGTAASLSQLRVGDQLLGVNGYRIPDIRYLRGTGGPAGGVTLEVLRGGRELAVQVPDIRSMLISTECPNSVSELVGTVGLPIVSIAPSSQVQDVLSDLAAKGMPMYVISANGDPIPASHLGTDGNVVDGSGGIRAKLSAGTGGPFTFRILSGVPSTSSCQPWKLITFKLEAWHGGIAVGAPSFVPYIGGTVTYLGGGIKDLQSSNSPLVTTQGGSTHQAPSGGASLKNASVSPPQEAPTYDSVALGSKLQNLYVSYHNDLQSILDDSPQPPKINYLVYPRYKMLTQQLATLLRSSRVVWIATSLSVTQRISPTVVIASGFDGPAASPRFCGDDVCKYSGPVFVRLRRASVANELPPGWFRYDGLQSYTTVLGAPNTIPEFSEITLDDYPMIRSDRAAVEGFKPSDAERTKYVEPLYERYHDDVEAYYRKVLLFDAHYLQRRFETIEAIATPLFGEKVAMIQYNGLRPVDIPDAMVQSLPQMVEAIKKDTEILTKEIDQMLDSRDDANALAFLKYTQAWIHFTQDDDCFSLTPQPDAQQWPAPWMLTEDFQPWCSLRTLRRLPVPRLGPDGGPITPGWWGNYRQELGIH